jgi:hypothetical protein
LNLKFLMNPTTHLNLKYRYYQNFPKNHLNHYYPMFLTSLMNLMNPKCHLSLINHYYH